MAFDFDVGRCVAAASLPQEEIRRGIAGGREIRGGVFQNRYKGLSESRVGSIKKYTNFDRLNLKHTVDYDYVKSFCEVSTIKNGR